MSTAKHAIRIFGTGPTPTVTSTAANGAAREQLVTDPWAAGGRTVADVIERLMAEFEHRLDLDFISRVVLACRSDLAGSPTAALPELVERLAHQRLLDTAIHAAAPP